MSLLAPVGIASAWRLCCAALRPSSGTLTLDQLRSDLSHETAAKLARLAGLVREWRQGAVRPGDAADADAILLDLERIHLRHARLAAASFGTFARLARLLGDIRRGRRMRPAGGPDLERFAGLCARLGRDSQTLCEALCARHGVRFSRVVGEAVEELRGEAGDVAVTLEGADEPARVWVPRWDAAAWADVVRNLVRNAVQATRERGDYPGAAGVTVRLQPMRERPGATLEVLDEGLGMSPETLATMWHAGASRHGGQHGQGLTEGKRAFVESRGTLEVRSAEGVGTCVRVDVPHRDVPVRVPRPWALPPVALPALALVAALGLGAATFLQPDIARVDLDDTRVLAYDDRDRLVWKRDLGEEVLPNFLGSTYSTAFELRELDRFVVLPRRWPWAANVVVSTRPAQGPGHVWRLGWRGRTVWKRTLEWEPPREAHTGALKCVFQVLVPWSDGRDAIALNVRDADWSSTAIQFITTEGKPLGAYHHPGHLDYRGVADLDGDGLAELVLGGRNNRAPRDPTLYAEPPGEEWIECLLALEPPWVDGQAYPCSTWAGLPRAREQGYVLFPPLRRGPAPLKDSPRVEKMDFGRPVAGGQPQIEVRLKDGRIYTLDSRLRPLDCTVGSETYAATLAPTRALAPLLYFHEGRRDTFDLPVPRGS